MTSAEADELYEQITFCGPAQQPDVAAA
jgi:hypothetical protein